MKKSFSVLLLIILPILLFSFYLVKLNYKSELPETALEKSFACSGAEVLSSEVYFWGKIEKGCNNIDEMKGLAQSFINSLKIKNDGSFSLNSIENEQVKKVDVKGMSEIGIIDMSIQRSNLIENNSEKYISINVTKDLEYEGLDETRKKVLLIFKKFGIKPKVNSCIIGRFNGKLNENSMNDIGRNILKVADAKRVEGMRDKNLISVSAYSPFIENSIVVNGKSVNLNLAIRYNSYEDKTYIWLATPIITVEY